MQISPQMVINCGPGSCNGGNSHEVYAWLHAKGGATDETCQPYQAQSHECKGINVCRDCQHNGGCSAVANPTKYSVEQYGYVRGEEAMQREIKARGPITCRQAVTKEFLNYKGKGIFKDVTGDTTPRHATSLLGWGTAKDGTKYWVARNSWGTYWGENGFFKIARGVNNLGIEEECSWGVPKQAWSPDMLREEDRLVRTQDLGISNVDEQRDDDSKKNDQQDQDDNKLKTMSAADDVNNDTVDSQDDLGDTEVVADGPYTGDTMGNADADETFQTSNRQNGVQLEM